MKRLADALTFSRLIAGFALVAMGLIWGRQALVPAVALGLLAWSTDSVDGALARRDPNWHPTWVGEQDITFDAVLALGILAYFVLSGLFPARFALGWVAVWAVLFIVTRERAVLLLGLGGVDGMTLWALFRANADLGWVVILWMVVVAFSDRRRFRQVLAIFFGSASRLLRLSHAPKNAAPAKSPPTARRSSNGG
ncbi:MAG: CDP-alcohol phosphatidyltransferase family protein [Anaerolineae bacterium]|nr:CDP-alcohol phosphatidyltransferase family protein [Anaerolineae bacterium]